MWDRIVRNTDTPLKIKNFLENRITDTINIDLRWNVNIFWMFWATVSFGGTNKVTSFTDRWPQPKTVRGAYVRKGLLCRIYHNASGIPKSGKCYNMSRSRDAHFFGVADYWSHRASGSVDYYGCLSSHFSRVSVCSS